MCIRNNCSLTPICKILCFGLLLSWGNSQADDRRYGLTVELEDSATILQTAMHRWSGNLLFSMNMNSKCVPAAVNSTTQTLNKVDAKDWGVGALVQKTLKNELLKIENKEIQHLQNLVLDKQSGSNEAYTNYVQEKGFSRIIRVLPGSFDRTGEETGDHCYSLELPENAVASYGFIYRTVPWDHFYKRQRVVFYISLKAVITDQDRYTADEEVNAMCMMRLDAKEKFTDKLRMQLLTILKEQSLPEKQWRAWETHIKTDEMLKASDLSNNLYTMRIKIDNAKEKSDLWDEDEEEYDSNEKFLGEKSIPLMEKFVSVTDQSFRTTPYDELLDEESFKELVANASKCASRKLAKLISVYSLLDKKEDDWE